MAFKRKSYPVHPKDVEAFCEFTVVMAVLIDAGYVTHWPHEWTRDGNRSRRRAAIDDERHSYNAVSVYLDANRQLYCAGKPQGMSKPPQMFSDDPGRMVSDSKARNEAYGKLCRMRGDAADAEAID